MNSHESAPKLSGSKALAILFLPSTWKGWLTFLGVILFLIAERLSAPYFLIVGFAAFLILFFAYTIACVELKHRKAYLTMLRVIALQIGAVAGFFVCISAILLFSRALAFLVTNGSVSGSSSKTLNLHAGNLYIEFILVATIFWLIVGIPDRLFRISLDTDGTGDVQHVLLGLISVAALALTSVYILQLHFDDGPLSRIHPGPFTAAIILTTLLLAPFYRSLARACWRHGISGLFSPKSLRRTWSRTLTELDAALNRAADRGVTFGSEREKRNIYNSFRRRRYEPPR